MTPQQVPNPQQSYGGWVTDMANILSESTESQLNQQISALEAKNGTEIAIVTVAETQPSATPKQFATDLFNYWGIGKKGIANGVLFLISTGDRRVEIETGYGVEGILPDAKIGNIIDTKIIPQFKQRNFEQGIIDGSNALISILSKEEFDPSLGNNQVGSLNQKIALIISIFLALPGWLLRKKGAKNLAKPIPVKLGTTERLSIADINMAGFDANISLGNLLLIIALITVIAVALFPVSGDWATTIILSLIIGVCIGSVIWIFAKIISSVIGLSKTTKNRKFICEECTTEMQSVAQEEFIPLLRRPQQVASEIGSIEFLGYKCPKCYSGNHTLKDYYLRAYVSNSSKFKICPNCEELTSVLISDEITIPPTYVNSGIRTLTYHCYCCNNKTNINKTLPRKQRVIVTGGSYGGGYSGGDYEGGYGGGGGFDGGGGGFGGGDSGGGGAGGSW